MNLNHLRKAISVTFISAAAIAILPTSAFSQSDQPGDGRTVTIAQPNDDTGWIMSNIYGQLLEKLGYTIRGPLTLDVPVAYQAVSTGDADIYPDGWFPLHNVYLNKPGYNGVRVGYVAKQGALQGYLVDKASAEKYNIKTLDDFKKPEVRKAFDRNGDGKADMVACPPGWGCEKMIQYQLKAFNLRDAIKPIKANYAASMADAIGAYQDGEPILFYTWTPNWTVNRLKPGKDVVWIQTSSIKVPPQQEKLAKTATVSGVTGCVADPCRLGWPVNNIRPVVNKAFLKKNPAVETLLKEASIPLDFILKQNEEMHEGADSKKDLDEQAAAWIKDNQDKVDGWLKKARESARKQSTQ